MVPFDRECFDIQLTLRIQCNIMEESFKLSSLTTDAPSMKYVVLSVVSLTFDRFGYLTSIILKTNRILQSMWRLKPGCDDKVPKLQVDCWNKRL